MITFLNEMCGFVSSETVCKWYIRAAPSKQQEMALPEPCASYQVCLNVPCILPLLSKAAFEMLLTKRGSICSIHLHTKCSRVSLTYALQSFGDVFLPRISHGECLVFWGHWSTCIWPRPGLLFTGDVGISFSKHKARIPAQLQSNMCDSRYNFSLTFLC